MKGELSNYSKSFNKIPWRLNNFVIYSEMCYGRPHTSHTDVAFHTVIFLFAGRVDAITADFEPRQAVVARSRWRASVLF